jgi:hypothetical protein
MKLNNKIALAPARPAGSARQRLWRSDHHYPVTTPHLPGGEDRGEFT